MSDQIYVVEDHPIVRQGFASLVDPEPGLRICGETGSATEARRHLSETDPISEAGPDLVVLDLSLEEGSGLSLLEHLEATQPDLPVLVVSMYDETLYARRTLDSGAAGYLMKNNANEKVVEAIRRVLKGNVYLSAEMISAFVSSGVGSAPSPGTTPVETLTDRELEVLTLIGQGLERREIAEALSLSPKTIDTHRINLQEKLSLDGSASLRRYAAVWRATADGEQRPTDGD